jgi:predicted dehydrogenase
MAQYGTAHAHASGHAAVLKANPDVDFAGVFEPSAERREAARLQSAYAGVHWFGAAEEMLADETISAVAIEGAVHENLAFARDAVESGKHVWLDKPAGDDYGAFRRVVEVARERRLLVQLGYMFRYNDGFRSVMRWAQDGLLGEVFAVRGRMSTALPPSACEGLARHRGGILFELLCHLMDLVVFLLGRPQRVTSYLRDDGRMARNFADNTLTVLEYDRTLVMLESAAMETAPFPVRRFEVYGTRGSAVLQPLEPPALRLCLDAPQGGYERGWQVVPVADRPRYVDDVIAFVADIRGEKAPDRSLDHELLVQETVLRASGVL